MLGALHSCSVGWSLGEFSYHTLHRADPVCGGKLLLGLFCNFFTRKLFPRDPALSDKGKALQVVYHQYQVGAAHRLLSNSELAEVILQPRNVCCAAEA